MVKVEVEGEGLLKTLRSPTLYSPPSKDFNPFRHTLAHFRILIGQHSVLAALAEKVVADAVAGLTQFMQFFVEQLKF